MSNARSLVRPIVTLMFAGGFTVGFFMGKISQDAYVPVVGMIMSWWFATRADPK
jgi:hypothetical protein